MQHNTHTVQKAAIKDLFAGTLPGVESNPATLPAFVGCENSVLLPKKNPNYKFATDQFSILSYAWVRENTRKDDAPRRGILIGGPKDAGKTTVLEQFYARLGVPLVALTCNRRQPLTDYLQKMVPDGEGGWQKVFGPLAVAMKEGYPVVLNEISAMDPCDLISMHDIIDRGYHVFDDGEVLQAKQGFMVHATDNTMGYGDDTGSYADTNELNGATLRRFFKMEVDYPSAEDELEILKAYYPKQDEAALGKFIQFANLIRGVHRSGKSPVTMGVGEVINWIASTNYFAPMAKSPTKPRNPAWFAFKVVLGSGLPKPEFANAVTCFKTVFGDDVADQ